MYDLAQWISRAIFFLNTISCLQLYRPALFYLSHLKLTLSKCGVLQVCYQCRLSRTRMDAHMCVLQVCYQCRLSRTRMDAHICVLQVCYQCQLSMSRVYTECVLQLCYQWRVSMSMVYKQNQCVLQTHANNLKSNLSKSAVPWGRWWCLSSIYDYWSINVIYIIVTFIISVTSIL